MTMKRIIILIEFIFLAQLSFAKVILVTNNNDSGIGSFREAIKEANSIPGYDTIELSISGIIELETNPCPTGINILELISDSLCILGNGIELKSNVSGRFFQSTEFLIVYDINLINSAKPRGCQD